MARNKIILNPTMELHAGKIMSEKWIAEKFKLSLYFLPCVYSPLVKFMQDIQTLDPEEFSQTESINITALSLIDPTKPKIQSIIDQWNDLVVNGFRNKTFGQFHFDDNGRGRYRQPAPSPTEPVPNLPNRSLKVRDKLFIVFF